LTESPELKSPRPLLKLDDFSAATLAALASLAAVLRGLTVVSDRREAAQTLARALGADDLILFLRDPELNVLLPAPGFPQTLPEARIWHAFLEHCVGTDSAGPDLSGAADNYPTRAYTERIRFAEAAEPIAVTGMASGPDTVFVLLGGTLRPDAIASVIPFLPVVVAALNGERAAKVAEAHARIARDAATRADGLAGSLDGARAALQSALDEVRESRRVLEEQATALETANDELIAQAEERQAANEELEAQTEELEITTEELQKANDRLAASEQQLRTLADAIPTLAWTAGADGYIDWYNRRWYDYTGATPDEMAGWGWQSVHDPEVLPGVIESWRASIATGVPFEMEFPLRGADGVFRWFLTRSVPVTDALGRVVRWFGTNTNVDEQRTAREMAGTMQKAAEAANQAKSDFLANMSHELRTPLNAIGGYVQLLELGIHGPVTEAQLEALGRVQRSQQHLLSLINDILNFAKLDAGRVEYKSEDVRIADIVADIMPMIEPQLASKGLTYEVQVAVDLVVVADRDKLQQVLLNLLSNAVKFTEPGGRITVDTATGSDVAYLRVSDTGCGIPRDQQESVFDPFVQVPRGREIAVEGTGLGLAISRDLARGMGGDLRVRSTPEVGSTFTVTLPHSRDSG
jgi:PAS domain S-box-containing protein